MKPRIQQEQWPVQLERVCASMFVRLCNCVCVCVYVCVKLYKASIVVACDMTTPET